MLSQTYSPTRNVSSPFGASIETSVRVTAITADDQLVATLEESFEVERLTLRVGLAAPEQIDADVVLLDVRHHHEFVPAARLAAEGSFALVAMARPQDSTEAMKYLDVGALDVIWSGAAPSEVSARIRSAARYARSIDADWVKFDDLAISVRRREVRRAGQQIRLTPTEFRLVEALANAGGRTVSHRALIAEVWGLTSETARHQLRVYVRQLREKLERDPARPTALLTEPGVGYRLAMDSIPQRRAS